MLDCLFPLYRLSNRDEVVMVQEDVNQARATAERRIGLRLRFADDAFLASQKPGCRGKLVRHGRPGEHVLESRLGKWLVCDVGPVQAAGQLPGGIAGKLAVGQSQGLLRAGRGAPLVAVGRRWRRRTARAAPSCFRRGARNTGFAAATKVPARDRSRGRPPTGPARPPRPARCRAPPRLPSAGGGLASTSGCLDRVPSSEFGVQSSGGSRMRTLNVEP